MSSGQIISLYQFDHHPVRVADGGTDHPSNLRPLLIAVHRVKTAKHDAPDMARERRVRRAVDAHAQRMLLKRAGKPKPPSRWPKRSFSRRSK